MPSERGACRLSCLCRGWIFVLRDVVSGYVVVEPFEDAGTQSFLELEEDAYPCQVHAQVLGQVPNPEDSTNVVFGIQTDVGPRPRGAEQAFSLVDPERPGMNPNELRGHADDVDRPGRITSRLVDLSTIGHRFQAAGKRLSMV